MAVLDEIFPASMIQLQDFSGVHYYLLDEWDAPLSQPNRDAYRTRLSQFAQHNHVVIIEVVH